VHVAIAAWLGLSVLCSAWVAWDVVRGQPEILPIMKIAWVLITLYTGIVGLIVYLTACREPAPDIHEQFIAPMWKQAVGSTVHCIAGDGVGIVIVAGVVTVTSLRWYQEFTLEYLAAFVTGWLLFQAVAMGSMMGGFRRALRSAFLAEAVSLTAMVSGMFPTMYWVMGMSHEGGAGDHLTPAELQWWAGMSIAILVGSVAAYPVNWWLVKTGRKHGMASRHAMGGGGHAMPDPADAPVNAPA